MNAEMNNLSCGRENDLVSFLYDELGPSEKQDFQSHIHDCAGCKSQVGSFTEVRESVVAWRNESLGAVTSAFEHLPVASNIQQRPSALAALREFFNLSPLWMKGTVAFASLLFCLFAVLAAARLTATSPETTIMTNANSNPASSEEFKALVERRVQEELARRQTAPKDTVVAETPSVVENSPRRPMKRNAQLARATPQRKAPLSRLEREQLAADLRLIADPSDSELVLIGDRINQ